jgi:4-amino-4-deoxy-L-arabinose transferase-like glycosyltransferase
VAISPQLIGVEHDVLTDYLFGVLAFLGAAALAAGVSRRPPSWRWLGGAGVLFGVATLIRPSGQALVLAAPVVLAVATRNLRATLRGTVVVTAAMALFVVPWIVRNAVHDDAPTLSVKGYQALFMRVFDQDHLRFATSGPDTRVAEAIYARDPAPPGVTTNRVFDVLTALTRRDQTLYEASKSEAEMAAGAIVASPFAYAKGTVRNLGALTLTADPVRASNSVADLERYRARAAPTTPALVRTPIGAVSRAAWRVGEVLCVLSWLFVAAWVVALLSLRRRSDQSAALAAFAVVWLVVVGVTASAAIPDRRFGAQGLALFWLVGAVGFVLAVRMVMTHVAHRRSPGPVTRE